MAESHEKDPRKSVLAALMANTAIAIAKFAAAGISGSSAMLAEALHSTADTGNQALLLFGIKRAERPADEGHPFGHGKARFVWGLPVAARPCAVRRGSAVCRGAEGPVRGRHRPDPPPALLARRPAVCSGAHACRAPSGER